MFFVKFFWFKKLWKRSRRIALFAMSGILCLSLIPCQPAVSIKEFDIETVKQVEDGMISDIAKKDIRKRAYDAYKMQYEDGIRIDKEYMDLESGFSEFPETAMIDLTMRDVDVASILRILAKEGGMNIVIDESVMGFISAELKNISLNDAMQIILTSEELEARVAKNTVFVASRPSMAKKGLNRRYIKTYKLNNSNAVYIASILRTSIFNKGYKVNESSAEADALPAIPAAPGTAGTETSPAAAGSSTGQSTLLGANTIKGKVETLQPSENFGDAGKLASTIKVQHYTAQTSDIQVDNNDGGAIVIPDTRTNSLLVAGLKRDILLAEEAIRYLDKPLKQVSIEVSLIELKNVRSKDLGVSTTIQGGKTSGGFNAVSGTFANDYGFSSIANQTGITVSTINSLADEVAFKINALIEEEEAKLLANPKIVAVNGSESLIKITEQVVSTVETTITDTAITYDAELADVGIVLNILPKIGNNGYITMRIRPSITSALPQQFIGEFATGGGGTDAAIKVTPISTREVILQDVRVKSGETLAIAGLTQENEVLNSGKIPFLGDLPLIGKLFSDNEFDHEKTELIILIRPIIIEDIAYSDL